MEDTLASSSMEDTGFAMYSSQPILIAVTRSFSRDFSETIITGTVLRILITEQRLKIFISDSLTLIIMKPELFLLKSSRNSSGLLKISTEKPLSLRIFTNS